MKELASAAIVCALSIFSPATRLYAQNACLHGSDETATQRTRRVAALRFVRTINSAESNEAQAQTGRFQPLATLSVDVSGLSEWDRQFTTDGTTYALLLVDKTDPCRFAFATNQTGLIFQAYPIDFEVQPLRR